MTPAALYAEIAADPESLGYAGPFAAGDDTAVAELLNAISYRGPVPIAELSAYCVRAGVAGGCEAAVRDPAAPLELRVLCHTVLSLLRGDWRLTTADVDDPAFGAACDGLVGAGLLTEDGKAVMLAMADGRLSRAGVLWGRGVTPDDVGAARKAGG